MCSTCALRTIKVQFPGQRFLLFIRLGPASLGGNKAGKPQNIAEGRKSHMKEVSNKASRYTQFARNLVAVAVGLMLAAPAFAQAQGNSPWENAVGVLQQAFTSTIARGLSLVAIVVSGLTFAFGEGGSKRVLAGVLFGVGMAIAAVNFLAWLFPGA